ncbi:MAG: OadG family protein [Clostridia bacterium]|nr:OadG family protein [Clostridia bacterium]
MTFLTGSIANEIGLSHLNIGDAGLYALLGYAVVFLGLVLLMIVVMIVGKIFSAADQKKAAKAAAAAPAPVEDAVPAPTAPGAAGELKLHDVEPKIAAMLMAIVADKMGKPLNELRFISIKEVK